MVVLNEAEGLLSFALRTGKTTFAETLKEI
jgi:hypothetical protein